MRYIELPMGSDRFEVLYEGIHVSPRGYDRAESRVLSHLLNKFEALAQPKHINNRATFAQTKSGTLVLEDVEYALLKDTVEKVQWVAAKARQVTAVLDYLDEAPTEPPVEAEQSVEG